MIIPLLTQILPEPSQRADMTSKPRTPSDADNTARRNDDRDFASVMADRKRDARKDVRDQDRPQDTRGREPAADTRQRPEQPAEKPAAETQDADAVRSDRADDAAASAPLPTETPRRQVTIPELPAKRQPALPGETEATAQVAADTPDVDAALAAAIPAEIELPKAETATRTELPGTQITAEPTKANATAVLSRTGETAGLRIPAAMPNAGVADATVTAEPEMLPPTELEGATAGEQEMIHRRESLSQLEAGASARVPPAAQTAQQAAQSTHMRDIVQMSAQTAAEDRKAARTREPVARAVEAVAASTAPAPQALSAQTSAAAQIAVLQPAARDAIAAREKSASAFSLEGEAESLRFDMRGGSGTTSTQHASFAPALARGDMGRHVAMQIADFARNMPDRPVDVSLSPEELGRVRLSISTGDGGVTLHVLAERPETLDLMRRHADQLARDLADLGFASIDLAFGQGRDPESGTGDGNGAASGGGSASITEDGSATAAEDPAQNRLTLTESGGLDIRI